MCHLIKFLSSSQCAISTEVEALWTKYSLQRLPPDVWLNHPQEWPPDDFSNIYVFLIDTPCSCISNLVIEILKYLIICLCYGWLIY